MGKSLGAVFAGIAAGIVVQAALAWLVSLAYPMAAAPFDRRAMAEAYASVPTGGALLNMLAFFLAAAAAAWVARRMGGSVRSGWIAAGVIAAIALVIALVYPDPAWAQIGALAAALLGGLVGCHLPVATARSPASGSDDATV
jgi:uncharacterized membrane protein (DUF485 family)